MSSTTKLQPIVIVGAGLFGLTTALELQSRGYTRITILDRYLPPVPDGSSVDISRVIRTDYNDSLYSRMAHEAQELWMSKYKDFYYPCGTLILAETKSHEYIEKSKKILRGLGDEFVDFESEIGIQTHHPAVPGDLSGMAGYSNPHGGWVNASAAIASLAARCSSVGVSFVTGSRGKVLSLKYAGNSVVGVIVASGPAIVASKVILATGAWTCRITDLSHTAISTGQPVGFIQLTPAEAFRLRDMPVCINLSSGFFCFPPSPTHILKVARHGFGYENCIAIDPAIPGSAKVSSPKMDSNCATAGYIPADADRALREGLKLFLPDFANRPWLHRRLCWYTDTANGDFIVDHHPQLAGLFFATGGSGQ